MSQASTSSQMSAGAPALEAWPEVPPMGPGRPGEGRRPRGETITTTSRNTVGFREYLKYKELFVNLTLRELRSKYKRSVIGWGWSMINPLANMLIYMIVFSVLLRVPPMVGIPSHLHTYALMYLSAMLPFSMWQGSIMESMPAMLGNQNLIQKTWFPRELIPAATVASKLISHLIEMALLLVVVVAVGNFRALEFAPGVLVTMAVITMFALGMALLFSVANVYWRDIQHFSNILFFIWMFLTPVVYPYWEIGGGINGTPKNGVGGLVAPRMVHLFGHVFSLGTLFKANPMTDAILTMQSFIYDGSLPGTTHRVLFSVLGPTGLPLTATSAQFASAANGAVLQAAHAGYSCSVVSKGVSCLVASPVSWFDVCYFAVWALALFVIGLSVFRKFSARLPEEL
ncbi:MAG: ABC transporter permease [Actinomycetota bacterium]|nr:ABC transporter permease [Actinomycetota bacterium]